jgi:hypothetical protein
MTKPETAPVRPSIVSAVLEDGSRVSMPDDRFCHCGRLQRPGDVESTGNGWRQICTGCHGLVFEIEIEP